MNICLRILKSQIHKIRKKLYFESLLQCILTQILMITRPGKDYKVIKINTVIQQ